MKKCCIVGNGFFRYGSMDMQIDELKRALTDLGAQVDVTYTDKVLAYITQKGAASTLGDYAFIVYLDKDVYISHLLEKCGYTLVNSADAIEVCDDKMKTHLSLAGVVPMPKTLASPLQFKRTEVQYITEIEKVVGYPIVVKEVFGSLGANVHLAENREQLKSIRNALLLKPHIYQEFIGSGGSDLRLIVIGGKVVACMRRVNENDFRSNVELGGRGENVTPTKRQIEYAERAAKAIKLDYCGIDILSDQTGDYVCEVNSNAFWRAVSEVSGVNVAKAYAKYLFDRFFN